jgi:site-specific recombinase XerD
MTAALRTSLPFAAWPKTDQALWQAAQEKGGIFERDGAAAHWAEATAVQVAKGYGKWLWALQRFGSLDAKIAPAARVTEDLLRRYVAQLQSQGLSSVTITSRITDLVEALRVMDPNADLTLLRGLVSTLHQRAQPSRNKARRIKPPGEIWEACAEEMARIAAEPAPLSFETASRYRDAFALGFLVWSPIRRRNLAALNLGGTLRLEAGRWRVAFGAEATKDKSPLVFALPEDDAYQQALEHYLMRIRPRLLRRPAIANDTLSHQRGPLWISTRGKAMTAHALYYAVTRSSERLLGAPLNPHLLRDCAASAITTARPDHVLAASRILGHNQLSTTLTHYEQASMLEAGARLQEVLEEIQARQTGNDAMAASDSSDAPFNDPWETL